MKITLTALLFILTFYPAFASQEKKQVKIRITAQGGWLDETMIYFDLGINPAFVAVEDAPKTFSTFGYAPSIYSVSADNVFCVSNGYSRLTNTEIIPLGIKADSAGLHTFTATLLSNLDPSTIVQLEDRLLNVSTNLRSTNYTVHIADSLAINGRFFLHVSKAIQYSAITAGCLNNDGELHLNQDNTVSWTSVTLYDSVGVAIDSLAGFSGPYSFTHLPEGNYTVVLLLDDYMITKVVYVKGNYVVARLQQAMYYARTNQEIVFNSESYNGTIYQWAMGDNSEIEGISNPTYSYLQPGLYTVVFNCSNEAGCHYSDSVSVNVSAATGLTPLEQTTRNIWTNEKSLTIVLNETLNPASELKVFNLTGQLVYSGLINEPKKVIALNELPGGSYIILVANNHITTTKRVILQ